jgi:hypothetical protein
LIRANLSTLLSSTSQVPAGFPWFSPLLLVSKSDSRVDQPAPNDPLSYSFAQVLSSADQLTSIAIRAFQKVCEPIENFNSKVPELDINWSQAQELAAACEKAVRSIEWGEWNEFYSLISSIPTKLPKS